MSLANPLAHGASPGPLNAGSPGSAIMPELDRSTWQREMERAMSAAWFHFDEAMPALQPRAEAPVAASASPSATAPSPRGTSTSAASSEVVPRAHATAKAARQAQKDGSVDPAPVATAGAAQSVALAQVAVPSQELSAAHGAPLPASLPNVAPAMTKLPASPATAAIMGPAPAPAARAQSSVAAAGVGQSIAAALAVAYAATPAQGIASGAEEEPAPVPEPAPSSAPRREIPPAFRDLFGPDEGVGAESAVTDEAPAAGAARDEAKSAQPAAPVRWHAEWDEQGVRVWLGLDSAAGIDAPQLAQQVLQSLGEQGVRVLSLVCNGKSLYGSAFPREQNARSGRGED